MGLKIMLHLVFIKAILSCEFGSTLSLRRHMCTVETENSGQSREMTKVTVVDRWPLF